MFEFLKRKKKDREYYISRFNVLAKELVPLANQAATKQGELVRCIANLRDESSRNGNMNWDRANDEELEFLAETLTDEGLFTTEACREIVEDLNRIQSAGQSGHDYPNADTQSFQAEEAVFERVMFRVVDWCDARPELVELFPQDQTIERFDK
jgi:hypothetical protein